jgi:hypothetical protein
MLFMSFLFLVYTITLFLVSFLFFKTRRIGKKGKERNGKSQVPGYNSSYFLIEGGSIERQVGGEISGQDTPGRRKVARLGVSAIGFFTKAH